SPSWKYLFYHPHGSTEVTGARQLRGAFSDTEDFLDHGLVSANRCSSRTSSISSWTDNIKPSFTKKLKFQSVLEGQPVELKCKLVACPPPTILWFHNNRSIPKERRRKICTDSRMHMHTTSLVIDSIKEKDSGSYKVMAINTEGSAETTASLLVEAPHLSGELGNITSAVGTPVILQCLVSGKPNPTAEWYKDGDRVTDSRCIIQEKTAGHFNLLITNVTESDAGEYKCIIENTAGSVCCHSVLRLRLENLKTNMADQATSIKNVPTSFCYFLNLQRCDFPLSLPSEVAWELTLSI
uniref:Ig-like domain-containing protein n=1 Tax=Lates calcarifer TaxID=8187 RepID=A0A4W6E3A9_LATCA